MLDFVQVAKAKGWVYLTPLYVWFAIFMLQDHKEERFLFPGSRLNTTLFWARLFREMSFSVMRM
jgi:hypothetical protein